MKFNPLPGTTREHNDGSYPADSGLDILVPVGTPVVAPAAGTLLYSTSGHTPWTTPPDTPNSILMRLDAPLVYKGVSYPLIWFTHLSWLAHHVPDGSDGYHVEAGELLGKTGLGNKCAHLHFGILIRREQADGDFMMPADVADVVWGGAGTSAQLTDPNTHPHIKIFWHDAIGSIVDENGNVRRIRGVKINGLPWIGGDILIGL